ncbi:MAG: RagB/SusD family nutrient uptake outer membrane protein [Bacteroidales bacterium]|nr:RagB/SusD family nutrient uptake outer membrane protein [Bacteroidales bacterium]
MKKNILTMASILGILLLSGCSDFLDTTKYGRPEGWQTEEDVWSAVAALYSNVSNDAEGVTGRGIAWFECCSDNVTVGRTQDEGNQIRNFKMVPNNGRDAKDTWPAMYQINAKANNIINVVPTMNSISDALKNKAIGTAYFWRGLSMLWIAPYYGDNGPNGGIPIVLNDTEPSEMDAPRPESVVMNYAQIIKDMRTAADYLPLFSELPADEYGLPHKAAAWAFAARAALYAAQWDKSYYDVVIEMCDKVMSLTGADKRELYDDGSADPFSALWTRENNFSSEYLFSLLGSAVDGPKYHGMSFQNAGWNLYNTWGYYQPTYNLYQAFENGDVRRDATILFPGQHIQFVGRDVHFGSYNYSISSDTGMTFRKFMSPWKEADCIGKEVNTNGNNSSNTLGMCFMRFADVLLMKAEALIATKGEGDAEAKTLLNRIRKRARLPENSPATWAELKNQRRCELAFEFMPSRHIDLVRWGDAKEVYAQPTLKVTSSYNWSTGEVDVVTGVHYDEGRTFDPVVNQVFPIPVAAFDGSVNLKQNIGY